MIQADQHFNHDDHNLCEQRWFEDFQIGERFPIPSRTMTSAIFSAFQAASGDNHPIHYDNNYCQARGMPGMLAHGFQVVIQTAAGAGLFPHMINKSLKAFLDQKSQFLAPVFLNDTLYPVLTVSALKTNRTTGVITLSSRVTNQHGTCVMTGEHRYLLLRRNPLPTQPSQED